MLILLPPSETKREGGTEGSRLDLGALSFPELARPRRAALAALGRVSRSVVASTEALGLGPTQRGEIERNRMVRRSAVMPALDRYSGVLFDALGAETWNADARSFAERTIVVHSALFGFIGAADAIPAYRLSHDSHLPDLSLRTLWRAPLSAAIGAEHRLVLDLRSQPYAALGPVSRAVTVTIVADAPNGRRLAMSHDNKAVKGRFVRELIAGGTRWESGAELADWATARGIRTEADGPRSLSIVVPAFTAERVR